MKRLGQIVAGILLLLASLTGFAETNDVKDFDYSRPDFQEVVSMLSMEGHGTHDVSSCSVKKIYYEEIAEMMTDGMSKDEVIAYYVDNLGEQALMAPPKKGFNLALWGTPFVILIISAVLILYVLKKWRKRNGPLHTTTTLTETNEIENEILSTMIDAERKKYL